MPNPTCDTYQRHGYQSGRSIGPLAGATTVVGVVVGLAVAGALAGCASSSATPQTTPAPAATRGPATGVVQGPGGHIKEFGTMWTFEAPPLDYWKAQYDFVPPAGWLDHVRLAAVRLPECSASFVSARGLVMTNHHCARDCTAAVSPHDSNYVETGFSAPTLADERKCPDFHADQLQSIEDVTATVRSAITASPQTPGEQVAQRTQAITKIERECVEHTQLRCQVVTFYQGGAYALYRYKRYTDVRLVMAPEADIAFYGGDPDNFTYPRYDLDLTLLRVYDNGRPLAPSDYLRWSARGAADSELVFVVGNPGSTGRLLTVAQMEFLRDAQYPAFLSGLHRALGVMRARSAQDPAAARALQNDIFDFANSEKALTGYESGLRDSALMARKRAFEADFRRRVAADPALQQQYGDAWDAIARAETALIPIVVRRFYYRGVPDVDLLSFASAIVRVTAAASQPDSARPPALRGDGLAMARARLLNDQPVDVQLQQMLMAAQLHDAQRDLPADDPYLRAALSGQTPDAAAARLIHGTTIATADGRRALLDGGAAAVASSTDPLIVLARTIDPAARALNAQAAQSGAVITNNAERIGRAIFAAYGRALPPDATFTLRISDGVVSGYPMNGTRAPYKTTFYGLYDRAADFDNARPFKLPPRWAERRARLDLSTPLDFVSTNDIIGGNSGSPVINRAGEVVGLIFNGNIESLPNNFIYTDESARSVSVSSRAITEALRKLYDGGGRLADELEGKLPPS